MKQWLIHFWCNPDQYIIDTAIDHYYNKTAQATGGHFEHTASTQSPYDLLKYCVL